MSQEVVSYYEDFNEIEKKIWDLLTKAVTDRSSEFRTPVFICGNDKDLDGRVVVLRKADQEKSFVQYHSDIRSSKIEKIKKNPNCSILFYGKQEKIQLRLKTECKVQFNDDVTIADAKNIVLNTTTGTKIGTATDQKLGFFNTNPVVQRASAEQVAINTSTNSVGTAISNKVLVAVGDTSSSDQSAEIMNNIATLAASINEIRTVLVNLGLMKGSA